MVVRTQRCQIVALRVFDVCLHEVCVLRLLSGGSGCLIG